MKTRSWWSERSRIDRVVSVSCSMPSERKTKNAERAPYVSRAIKSQGRITTNSPLQPALPHAAKRAMAERPDTQEDASKRPTLKRPPLHSRNSAVACLVPHAIIGHGRRFFADALLCPASRNLLRAPRGENPNWRTGEVYGVFLAPVRRCGDARGKNAKLIAALVISQIYPSPIALPS
jgi:hypothetical protein